MFEWAFGCARGAFPSITRLFAVIATRTLALARTHGAYGKDDHGKDDQQHYDGGEVHEMMALAMR